MYSLISGKIKIYMALHKLEAPLIKHGWIRALLLYIVYLLSTVSAGMLTPLPELWFAISFGISFIIVFVFRKLIDKRSFKSLGFHTTHILPDAAIGSLLGIFLVSFASLILYYLRQLEWVDIDFNAENLIVSTGVLAMIAFSEELVFRAYMLRNFMKSFDKWTSLFVSSLAFTLVHISNEGIPAVGIANTFLGGLVLGICFILSRNIWLPAFFHLFWNFIQGPVIGYPVSGFTFSSLLVMQINGKSIINGGSYGLEGSLICTLLLCIAFAAGCYLEMKKPIVLTGS
jgi:membrane protease YdiL (CAAX protease family)